MKGVVILEDDGKHGGPIPSGTISSPATTLRPGRAYLGAWSKTTYPPVPPLLLLLDKGVYRRLGDPEDMIRGRFRIRKKSYDYEKINIKL